MPDNKNRALNLRIRIAKLGVTHGINVKMVAAAIGRNYNYVLNVLKQVVTSKPVLDEVEEYLNALEEDEPELATTIA